MLFKWVFPIIGILFCSCTLPAEPTSRELTSNALKGVFLVAESPARYPNYYRIQVFGKYNYQECESSCPLVDLFVSVIGEGDAPEMASFFLAPGFAWKLERWESLPEVPLTDTDEPVRMLLSRIPVEKPNAERESLRVNVDLSDVQIVSN